MEKSQTRIITQEGKWDRSMYLEIVGDEVIFDTSNDEYGPCYFPLEILEQKLKEHKEKLNG